LFVGWYSAFIGFWPVTNQAKLADGPAVYVRLQGEHIGFVSPSNPLSLSL
jgi:hypothetical protein